MTSGSSRVYNILDIPDEILARIILYFDIRERLALANSCTTFNRLVFGDKELVRYLDFSRKGNLTTVKDIQQYFSKEATREIVRKVNIQNVKFMKPGHMLNNSIGRAINLVDINVHGTTFEEIEELGSFLKPLLHLKRLSVDWPKTERVDRPLLNQVLQEPLSRLTYLSAKVRSGGGMFLPTVQELCQELEELRMRTTSPPHYNNKQWSLEPNKPSKLQIVQFRGMDWRKDRLMAMIPDPNQWTDLYLLGQYCRGYLERNLEVCEELRKVKFMQVSKGFVPKYPDDLPYEGQDTVWNVLSEDLLKEAITLTHEDVPETFRCLSRYGDLTKRPCLLRIDEAKRLLKDPGYQIFCLQFNYGIDQDCDAHLVASAFPNLTQLALSHISIKKAEFITSVSTRNVEQPFKRRLRKRGSTAPEEQDDPTNMDSSFKILVENTPHVKDLAISSFYAPYEGHPQRSEWWDLNSLYLIPGWKSLRSIRLKRIPIKDGNFLIDIGKECPKLEVLMLSHMGFSFQYCWGNELLLMLRECRNLKKFTIIQPHVDNLTELFHTLSNISKLNTVRVMTETDRYNAPELISRIKQMLHGCPELAKFVFAVKSEKERVTDELIEEKSRQFDRLGVMSKRCLRQRWLRAALARIVGELNRPNFVFYGPEHFAPKPPTPDHEDASTSFFPSPFDDQQFEDYSWWDSAVG